MSCIYIDKNRGPELIKCNHIKKYGNYCYKHRSFHLLDNQNKIIYKNFTFNKKDYTIANIKNTLKTIAKDYNKIKNYKKDDLFNILLVYYGYNDKIIKIQSYIRKYIVLKNIKYRGIGYYIRHKCKNSEDFLYMKPPEEIEDKYFFSYKDNENSIWFFDIRSFHKLLETSKLNPYTRSEIPDEIILKSNIIILKLNILNVNTEVETLTLTNKKEIVKQKTIDLFSNITQDGYYCDIDWFLNLELHKLKNLYKKLEDIWNYRAYLTQESKSKICPPNGLVFNIPVIEIIHNNNKVDLQDIILNEVMKFNNAVLDSDRKLGYMYFLIGLSEISQECLNSHEWIQFIL